MMDEYDDPKQYGKGPVKPSFALKIRELSPSGAGYTTIIPEDDQQVTDPITVPDTFIERFNPQPGGYYIMCEGGVALYSDGPA